MFLNKILITHPPTTPSPRPLCCGGLSQRPSQPVHPLSPAVLQPTSRKPYNLDKLDLQAGFVDKWFRTQPGVIEDEHLIPDTACYKVHHSHHQYQDQHNRQTPFPDEITPPAPPAKIPPFQVPPAPSPNLVISFSWTFKLRL